MKGITKGRGGVFEKIRIVCRMFCVVVFAYARLPCTSETGWALENKGRRTLGVP
ncbi:hypothetical protein B4096_1829 [Heyndrickxia coagulans]|nr:hypothetical protein B4096_1829 [Heyndrickxia coagulans]